MADKNQYLAYLLRLWREGESASWRAVLHDPHTGEHHSFASLEKLLAFLEEQTGEIILNPQIPALILET